MKICLLSFMNLNSLSGAWSIDFTAKEYAQSGIFAITGPTGSGKSTILDALCLALYGRTPRLDKVNKASNEVMSRGAGECFAEVTFETAKGRFTAHWSQRRARLRSDGELQATKHDIAYTGGAVIESSLRLTEEKIVELTGMDFDRFTRSMLLAQGGFTAFLNAKADERSPILEQITGTEIYSTISIQVHLELKKVRDQLQEINGELSGIAMLSDEDRDQLQRGIISASEKVHSIGSERENIQVALRWLSGIAQLKNELALLEKQCDEANSALQTFKPECEKLQVAQSAAALEGDFMLLKKQRDLLEREKAELAEKRARHMVMHGSIAKNKQLYEDASGRLVVCKKEAAALQPLLRQVREIDVQNRHIGGEITEVRQELDTVEATIVSCGSSERALLQKAETLTADRERVSKYCKDHPEDASLAEVLISITEKTEQLLVFGEERSLLLHASDEVRKKTAHNQTKLLKLQAEHEKSLAEKEQCALFLQQQVSERSSLLSGKTLSVYRNEYDALLRERYYLQKIATLEEERKQLVDGTPCPLCGAEDHPFAHGTLPEVNEVDVQIDAVKKIIMQADEGERGIAATEKKIQEQSDLLNVQIQLLLRAQSDIDLLDAELRRTLVELQKLSVRQERLHNAILEQLSPFGINALAIEKCNEVVAALQKRVDWWRKAEEKLELLNKEQAAVESALGKITERISTLIDNRNERQSKLQKLTDAHTTAIAERTALFGDKIAETVEAEQNRRVAAAENEVQVTAHALQKDERELHAIASTIQSLDERVNRSAVEYENTRRAFMEKCAPAGFFTEADFEKALLPMSERNELAAKQRNLEDIVQKYRALLLDRTSMLEAEHARRVTVATKENLENTLEECDSALRMMSEQLGGDKQRLENDLANRLRAATHLERLETQNKICARWELLHTLIGSADGKKYRNFAQGITFEYLLAHANRQLQKMSDRYLLTNENTQPLELFVVDNYQAGEVRTARNLSGGESFIVSMALALGLSSMAGHTIRVDSLFLDEGFGTLDDDALETALETLSELKQDGKLIGVISHIPALKERISTQITVSPITGGKSVISGPGCRRCDL